jgi:hypothetical protein
MRWGIGPESQERGCESLKGPLAIDVLFRFFFHLERWDFQLLLVYLEKIIILLTIKQLK